MVAPALLKAIRGPDAMARRRAIAKAITLLESTRGDHRAQGDELLTALLPYTGKSFRLGISGVPGVGKSTTSVNLAVALARKGARVGLMDADVYGPNIPQMLGIEGQPDVTEDKKIIPPEAHGVKVISMGMLVPPDQPVIWRSTYPDPLPIAATAGIEVSTRCSLISVSTKVSLRARAAGGSSSRPGGRSRRGMIPSSRCIT